MYASSDKGTIRAIAILVVTTLALLGWYSHTSAKIVTFTDKAAFLATTGASSATGPLPNLGGVASATVGSVTFSPAPGGDSLSIGALAPRRPPTGTLARPA